MEVITKRNRCPLCAKNNIEDINGNLRTAFDIERKQLSYLSLLFSQNQNITKIKCVRIIYTSQDRTEKTYASLPATERDSDILVYCQFIDKDLDGDEPWYSC